MIPIIFIICVIVVVYIFWKYWTKYRHADNEIVVVDGGVANNIPIDKEDLSQYLLEDTIEEMPEDTPVEESDSSEKSESEEEAEESESEEEAEESESEEEVEEEVEEEAEEDVFNLPDLEAINGFLNQSIDEYSPSSDRFEEILDSNSVANSIQSEYDDTDEIESNKTKQKKSKKSKRVVL
jgi:hypothetical protein